MSGNIVQMPATPTTPSAQAQAREWIVRIDAGALDAQERQLLNEWLAADPQHAQLLDTHALLWNAASKAVFPPAREHSARPARGLAAIGRRYVAVAATCASLLLAGALWVFVWGPAAVDGGPVAYRTETGEHRPIALADGSSMHLNTGSTVHVAYASDRRRVVLDQGEGYFAVAKDRSRPFEVVAGRIIARAVGTQFSVQRRGDGQAEIVVFEGTVEVLDSATGHLLLRLGAGQAAVERKGLVVQRSLAGPELEREVAWQHDRIVFADTPLNEAIDEVNRYSAVPLILTDSALREVRVSGSFSSHEIPVFLRALESGFGLKVEKRAGGYEISRDAKS